MDIITPLQTIATTVQAIGAVYLTAMALAFLAICWPKA